MFDLLIRNANIVDGTGKPGFQADVAVRDGKIADVGAIPIETQAGSTLNAQDLTLAPGFIDIHTHADIALLARPDHLPKVMQGVTTEVFTNCGLGFAPCTPNALEIQREFFGGVFGNDDGLTWNWSSVADFLSRYESQGAGTNIAYLIPHSAVRVSVMGMEARPADIYERLEMENMVAEGMSQGAWGLSTGLWYAPMCHADRAENVALCRAAGFFATHQRSYREGLVEATEETIAIAEEAGVPVQLSHLQLSGKMNHGRADEILSLLDRAQKRGVDITWDTYPYTAGSTLVQTLLPAWATDGGPTATLRRLHDREVAEQIENEISAGSTEWNRIHLAGARSTLNLPYEGMSFEEIAKKRGLTPAGYAIRLMIEDELQACFIQFATDENDVRTILQHPDQMIGSDGLHLPGKTHPRLYGTFPRILSRYVREDAAISLEEGVRKMTSAPAERLGLKDRGVIAQGMAADLALFDPATVRDVATFEDPLRFPEGIPYVWVNGVPVKWEDQPTHALPGHVLRRH